MKIGLIDIEKAYLGTTELTTSNAFLGTVPVIESPVAYSGLTLTARANNSSVGLTKLSSNQEIEYSRNRSTWTQMDTATTISMSSGDTIYIRGTLSDNNSISDYTQFYITGDVDASGNLNYLWNYQNPSAALKQYCGYSLFDGCVGLKHINELTLPATTIPLDGYALMFQNCTALVNSPVLPATTIGDYGYYGMFRFCASLTSAPNLPATNLSGTLFCYSDMFANCTDLTTLPTISATTLGIGCYYSMFSYCTSISSIPSNYLPVTSLTQSCYGFMFEGCTNLTTVPSGLLPASILTDNCYQNMFQNCSSLATVPSGLLPATSVTNYCYTGMFRGCTSLTEAPKLPATELAGYCYREMFFGCSGLTYIHRPLDYGPYQFPATALTEGCYQEMFAGCSSLTTVPALPAKTLVDSCYYAMFTDCTGLTTAPALPATTLAPRCYRYMFSHCSSLTATPLLQATTLAEYCYSNMFEYCSSLTTVSSSPSWLNNSLPATTLADYCYQGMFQGCRGLTTAPELPATTLTERCYRNMFLDCANLNYIKCLATNIAATNCTTDWVDGVAASGTFSCDNSMLGVWTEGDNGIPFNWRVAYAGLKLTSSGNSTVGLSKLSSNQTLEYSVDSGKTWSSMTTATTISLADGKQAYIKGTLTANNTNINYTQFTMTGNISLSGHLGYLWNYTNPNDDLKEFCGFSLFRDCVSISDISSLYLPRKVAIRCFQSMFQGCTGIATVPYNLLHVYNDSLYGADNCYVSMFQGCTALTNAPELPAVVLSNQCYYAMFQGCRGLTTAPELPATTLTERCYAFMFQYCSSLNYIKCMATNKSATECLNKWVGGVAATGDFYYATGTSWGTGVSACPSGWTKHAVS